MPSLTTPPVPAPPPPPTSRDVQARNLRIVGGIGVLLAIGVTVLGAFLYLGAELPPHDLHGYRTSPDGYAPPPPTRAPAGTVPRGSREDAAPGENTADRSAPIPSVAASDAWTNPLGNKPDAATRGDRLYGENCKMCHGEPGEHKPGKVGEAYLPKPPDLGGSATQALSDGRLYYLTTYGMTSTPTTEAKRYLPREWHAFAPLLKPEERWEIVAYLRHFGAAK